MTPSKIKVAVNIGFKTFEINFLVSNYKGFLKLKKKKKTQGIDQGIV